jgi:hypothetical protein
MAGLHSSSYSMPIINNNTYRESVGQPEVQVKYVMDRLKLNEVQNCIGWGEWPANLMAKPIESQQFTMTVLSDNLEEHCTHEWHPPVDGSATKCVLCLEWKLDVFNHVGEKLKINEMKMSTKLASVA